MNKKSVLIHGITCEKTPHTSGTEFYGHLENNDEPYCAATTKDLATIDNILIKITKKVRICGRCHRHWAPTNWNSK